MRVGVGGGRPLTSVTHLCSNWERARGGRGRMRSKEDVESA